MNELKIISVSRKTTSFSPVDEAKVGGSEKQNNTKNSRKALYDCFLPTLAYACPRLPVVNYKV